MNGIAQPKPRPALHSPTPKLGARVGTNLLLLSLHSALCTLSLSLAQVSHLLSLPISLSIQLGSL